MVLQGCKHYTPPKYHGKYGITLTNHGYSEHTVIVDVGKQKVPVIFDTGSNPMFVKGSGKNSYSGTCNTDGTEEDMQYVDNSGFQSQKCLSGSADVGFWPCGEEGCMPTTTPVFYKTLPTDGETSKWSTATKKFFQDGKIDGIIGAGWTQPDSAFPDDFDFGKSAFDQILQSVIQSQNSTETLQLQRMFGVQMCPAEYNFVDGDEIAGGFVSVGHSDSTLHSGEIQTVPVQKDGSDYYGYWCVEVEAIDIISGSETVATATNSDLNGSAVKKGCQSLVDTGNDVGITLVGAAYDIVSAAYGSDCPAYSDVDSKPTMQITFTNGVVLSIPPKAMYRWKDGKGHSDSCEIRLGSATGNNNFGQALLSVYYTEFSRLTDQCDSESDCTLGFAQIDGCDSKSLSEGQ